MTRSIRMLTLVSVLAVLPFSAQAALQRVGPVNPANGYPAWYQDFSGLVLDFCSPTTAAELSGGWCLLLPPVPSVTPEIYPPPAANPDAFSPEHFFWDASAGGRRTGVLFTMAVEGAFAAGPVIPGTQIAFGRIRLVIPSLPVNGTYTVYHPFGVWTFPNQTAGQRLFYTEDVGFNCPPGQFDCALGTSIGPFLIPSATIGGAELPPVPTLVYGSGVDPFYDGLPGPTADPGTGRKYLADPARIGPVTGSPLAPYTTPTSGGVLLNPNRFRIEITDAAGNTSLWWEDTNFSVQGRVFEGAIPGFVNVDRASYVQPVWASSTAAKLDVFATATAGMQARVPPAPAGTLIGAVPALVFWDAPCTIDAVTLLPIGPPAVGASHAMTNAGSNYWGQSPPPIAPPSVCVAQTNAPAAGGGTTVIYFTKNVVDEVTVSSGTYDPAAIGLTVNAASSDLLIVPAPTLTLIDFGVFTAGVFTSTGLPAPATLLVQSSLGGIANYQTDTGLVAGPPPGPVAVNDMVAMFEDCSSLPATACATPQVVRPLANDTLGGAPLVFGPGVTVKLTALPRLGVASYIDAVTLLPVSCSAPAPCTINSADGSLLYTPAGNVNGTDGFAYTVSTTDAAGVVHTSNIGGISMIIAPVNDPPVANPDTAATVANVVASIPVVVGSAAGAGADFDPDGLADIVAVVNVSAPVGPVGAIATATAVGLNVSFTANTAGTYTFTYQDQDTAGVLSNVATVTVTVVGAEVLTIIPPANFVVRAARWTVSGTDTPSAGQIIRLEYANGPNTGFVIGSVPVDALGNWLLDIKGVTGLFNPTTAQATQIKASSFIGGVATGSTAVAPITLK
jgi:hypothetical protein